MRHPVRILVVDPEAAESDSLASALEDAGYVTTTCGGSGPIWRCSSAACGARSTGRAWPGACGRKVIRS